MFSKYLKKSVSWNVKFTQPRKNSLSKYRKIYKIQSNNRRSVEKEKQKIMKLKSLYGNKNQDLNQNQNFLLVKEKIFQKKLKLSKYVHFSQVCYIMINM